MGKGLIIGIIAIALVGAFFVLNSNSSVTGSVVSLDGSENLRECNLAIKDMYCDACAYGVKAQIEELDGVVSAEINAWDGSGVVVYDADKVDADTIAAASTVYPASVVSDNPK